MAIIASLIETCKLNDVDPLAYLTTTLTAIVNGHKQSCIDDALTVELFGTSQRLKSAVGPNRSLAVAKIRRETPTFATEFCGEIPRKLSGKTGVSQKSGRASQNSADS